MTGPATQEFDTLCFEGLDAILQPKHYVTLDREPVLKPNDVLAHGSGTKYKVIRMGKFVASLRDLSDIQDDSGEQEPEDTPTVYSAA